MATKRSTDRPQEKTLTIRLPLALWADLEERQAAARASARVEVQFPDVVRAVLAEGVRASRAADKRR